ncbi:MAG: adenylate/guanylate cyclase domain-containing protein, partial [Albidovulum sp.]
MEASIHAIGLPRAIVFADIAGFSEMMGRDESATLEFMSTCSNMVQELGARFGGDLVQTTGDGYLVIFPATRSALDFGIELHRVVSKRQAGGRMQVRFRVGIHFGDVHQLNNSVYGHAVNVAARVQTHAEPGTCLLSRRAYEDVLDVPGYSFEWFGNPPLKNIHEDISLYRVLDAAAGGDTTAAPALVTVIGGLTLQYDGAEVRFLPSSKVSGFFAYLMLGDSIRQRRDKLASLLWPEGGTQSRRGLSYCRRRLSELCPERLIAAFDFGKGHIGLNELYFETDLEIIARELERGRVPPILIEMPDWPDAILEGFEQVGPVFTGWLRVLRESWCKKILAALSQLLARTPVDQPLCGDAARGILAADPGNEPASAKLILHLAGRGERIAAVDEFARLEAYLHAHHGLSPGEAVQAAVRRAQSNDRASAGNGSSPATQGGTPSSRLLRISVEPFEGAEPEDGHLVEGFRSDLLANLARFREWSVTDGARSRMNGNDEDRQAQYLVSGQYMPPPGDRFLRISLRDRASDRIVWSEDLAVNLADWAALQRNVIGRIAAHLETYISADRLRRIIGTGAQNAGSHDAWLRAEQIFARWTPESAAEAEAMLMRIIEADQAFAPAYSSLAGLQNVRHVIRPGLARDADGARRAHEFAERAVEIDPLDARNQLALAWTAAMTEAFDRAAIHLDLAAELNPNCASTLVSCAMAYAFTGQPAKAETLVAHAQRISPMLDDYQWCYVASVHFLAGRLEDALHAAQRSGDRIVDNPGWTAATLALLARTDEAGTEFRRLIRAVTPAWAGEGPPSAEAVFDWFVKAYPLRLDSDRKLLREA